MRRLTLLACLLLVSCMLSAQGIRIYKTDGSSSDMPISEIDRIECLPDMKFDVTDYSAEVMKMYVTKLGYKIPGEKEDREAVRVKLVNEAGDELLTTDGGIRLRGNSTSELEKKPWDLKLNEKTAMLGMPKDKRWVLLANYWDRTNLRNDVGLEIARRTTGMPWNPHSQYVQLYIDNKYTGLYLLCEKIKSSKNRVNITEMDATATAAPEVTGGYLLEFDYNLDTQTFKSSGFNFDVNIKEPDPATKEQLAYIQEYVNSMEAVLKNASQVQAHGYEKYLDVNSFIDFWLVGEVVMNKDFMGPASCYMYKDRNGVMFAGPIWDLDLYTFSGQPHGGVNNFLLKDWCLYYKALFADSKFVDQVKVRWQLLKASLENEENSIYDYIDKRSALISDEVQKDDKAYPKRQYSGKLTGDEYVTFPQAVSMMKDFLTKRIAALDELIRKL
ncbi:MAG: CotH kinase family protein [Bacteroidales bacterium]|nr:CotH kinase family protein [Candidatus Physcousia equi]